MTESMQVTVFGEARGNPGLAGAGVEIRGPNGKLVARASTYLGVRTPMQAEYASFVLGLEEVKRLDIHEVTLVTSHEGPYRQVTGKSSAFIAEVAGLSAQVSALLAELGDVELRLAGAEQVETAERLASVVIESRGRRQAID
jgi:ribonuclease HI